MKKRCSILLMLLLPALLSAQEQARYIFYFIGDGMGLNQVHAAEAYRAAVAGRGGVEPLLFTQFPVAGFATTYSSSSGVTDSAAAGTALSTGAKTRNDCIALDPATGAPLESIAARAHEAGLRVGVLTNVGFNDATPSAFYGRADTRKKCYELAMGAVESGFEFLGGAGIFAPARRIDGSPAPDIHALFEQRGYTIVCSQEEFDALPPDTPRVVMLNGRGGEYRRIPFALDREPGELGLPQMTRCALSTLTRASDEGFLLVVESGDIDRACHANDAAAMIHDVIELDSAVRVAYDFYLEHPDQTLIVVTADHETGGLTLGRGALNIGALRHQRVSKSVLSGMLGALRETGEAVTWQQVQELLGSQLGLWRRVKVDEATRERLYEAYRRSFVQGDTIKVVTLYQQDEKLAAAAVAALNRAALVDWSTVAHTAGYVPVFAIGAGAERFGNKMDNTQIPRRIALAAGF